VPSVIVACHPIKNPTKDNLEPYGGGSTMNEFDGNFTLWAEDDRVEWGWNKIRGPEFDTRYFYIEKLGSPHILDQKGRQPLLPVMRPMSANDAQRCEQMSGNLDIELLKAMIANPSGTQSDWARDIGRSKSSVNNRLQNLKRDRLVEELVKGKWRVTTKGIKAVK
jgi:hypothetical protein